MIVAALGNVVIPSHELAACHALNHTVMSHNSGTCS
jgi:hypothetical protein